MDSIDPIKPRNEITLAEFKSFKKRLVAQRKFNGCRSTCTVSRNKVELWSRAFSTVTNSRIPYSGKMPHIVEELEALGLPNSTILDGELVSLRGGDQDYFDDIRHCTNGHDLTNYNYQKDTGHWATWVVFDIPFLGGRALHSLSYEERYEILQQLFKGKKLKWLRIIESESVAEVTNPEQLMEKAVKLGYEGYVLKNLDSTYPITTFGKADKPSDTWWKVVPKKIADVVVTGYELGTPGSKYQDVVGKLVCVQYDLEGKQHKVCNVGTGFDDPERTRLLSVKYPKVGRVEYRFRRDDTHKLVHPAWLGFREEDPKQPKECIIEELL